MQNPQAQKEASKRMLMAMDTEDIDAFTGEPEVEKVDGTRQTLTLKKPMGRPRKEQV